MIFKKNPLLSICIPTYNRGHFLHSALRCLIPQVEEFCDAVEFVISDNCSTDSTTNVVEEAKKRVPIRYYRNATNIGAAGNIVKLCNELALGEFVWLLGDDDLAHPEAVKRILSVLTRYPEIDFVFLNMTCKRAEEREKCEQKQVLFQIANLTPTLTNSLADQYIDRWEELIDPKMDSYFMGSLMRSVFRLERWRSFRISLDTGVAPCSSLMETYPHSVVFAHTMLGCKAYYIGQPCVLSFAGKQEWIGYVPLIITVRLQELLDLYLSSGIAQSQISKCRWSLLSGSTKSLARIVFDPRTPGRQYFSILKFLSQNRDHIPRFITYVISKSLAKIKYRLAKVLQKRLRSN